MNEANKERRNQIIRIFKEMAEPEMTYSDISQIERVLSKREAEGEEFKKGEQEQIKEAERKKGRALTEEEKGWEKYFYKIEYEKRKAEEAKAQEEREEKKKLQMSCSECGGVIDLRTGVCTRCKRKHYVITKGSIIAWVIFAAILIIAGLYNTYKWGAERSESRIESLEEKLSEAEGAYEALLWSYGEYTKDAGFVVSSTKTGKIHRPYCKLVKKGSGEKYLLYADYEDAVKASSLKPCPICKPDENVYFTYE